MCVCVCMCGNREGERDADGYLYFVVRNDPRIVPVRDWDRRDLLRCQRPDDHTARSPRDFCRNREQLFTINHSELPASHLWGDRWRLFDLILAFIITIFIVTAEGVVDGLR